MDDDHLINALQMLKRNAKTLKEQASYMAWSSALSFAGEMASYYAEHEASAVDDTPWQNFTTSSWTTLHDEAAHRGGEVARRALEVSS